MEWGSTENAADVAVDSRYGVDSSRRKLYAAIPGVAGVCLAFLHMSHLLASLDEGLVSLTSGVGIHLVLALSLTGCSYWLWGSELPAAGLRRVLRWFVIGVIAMTIVGSVTLLYELSEGARLVHSEFLLLNFATVGGIGGILVGYHDAGTQARTEQLRIFREVVEHGGHSICITAPDGTIEYVNSTFETETGYSRSEALDETPRILNSGEQDETFYEEMWETITAGEIWRGELINERKDGSRYWIDQTIAPVHGEDGNVRHFVAINRDITERKEKEAELERQNNRLDEFASVVSHDLRNPLNVANGRVQMAKREIDSEHLELAEQSLDRMQRLIEDMLTLARQGEAIDEPGPVSIESVSKEAWGHVNAPDGALSVETDQVIVADDSRVQQLLENLFRNAVEHGGQDVSVHVGACDDGFYVADSGSGLPETDTEQLFESGFTTNEGGTGLGLAIVNRIAEAHGWEITARNDDGARFEITNVESGPRPTTDDQRPTRVQ